MRRIRKVALFGALMTTVVAVSMPGTASARTAKPRPADTEPVYATSEAGVEVYDLDGNLLAAKTFDSSTQNEVLGTTDPVVVTDSNGNKVVAVSGDGGTSEAWGCKTVWVKNVYRTLLGATAYVFKTELHWCWNRSRADVWDVWKDWDIVYTDGFEYWRGIVDKSNHFYNWNGTPGSGYHSMFQGSFENCVKFCYSMTYPKNTINGHSNGTWWWAATGT